MSDESKVGRPDRDQVNLEREIREWCQSHGANEDEVRAAVKEVQGFMTTLEMLVERDPAPARATQARHGGKRAARNRRAHAKAMPVRGHSKPTGRHVRH